MQRIRHHRYGIQPASYEISRRALHRRAVEAVIWGMPVVNFELMYREMVLKLDGGFNQVLFWSRRLDWRAQTLTPNPDVIYLMPFICTKDEGPMVLEIPPADDGALNGSIMDCWQAAIEDVGPGGVDGGRGGRYVILPPGSHDDVAAGFIPMRSDTYQGYALIRSLLRDGGEQDIARAVAYGKRVKVYPLSEAAHPRPTTFVDASGVVFDATIPYDLRFFESLDRIIQAEPWLERDKAMIDQLRTIGIERGRLFDPDSETQAILAAAVVEARAELEARAALFPPYYEDAQWFIPATDELHRNVASFFHTRDSYPVDARGSLYTMAFFSARHLGQAQYYLFTRTDADGEPLRGAQSYRLRVPAGAPVSQYWSITAYDQETHAFIRHAQRVGRSSQTPDLQRNPDGSVDLWFGPVVPLEGESNWIPTDTDGCFEVLARFYGPRPALFDRSWRLPDIERVA